MFYTDRKFIEAKQAVVTGALEIVRGKGVPAEVEFDLIDDDFCLRAWARIAGGEPERWMVSWEDFGLDSEKAAAHLLGTINRALSKHAS